MNKNSSSGSVVGSIRRRVSLKFTMPSLTKQSSASDCDINKIIERARVQGVVTNLNSKRGMYADVSNVSDYHSCLGVVLKAESVFADLPSKVRERFRNDPAEMISFLSDEKNRSEAESLGLVQKREIKPVDTPKGEKGDEVK